MDLSYIDPQARVLNYCYKCTTTQTKSCECVCERECVYVCECVREGSCVRVCVGGCVRK